MKKTLLATLLATSALITACDSKTPNCSATETKDLVVQILDEEAQRQGFSSLNQLFSRMFGIEDEYQIVKVHNIQTIKHNKDNDAYLCQADFIDADKMIKALEKKIGKPFTESQRKQALANVRNQKSSNIQYTVHKTDDGKQFIVNVLNR